MAKNSLWGRSHAVDPAGKSTRGFEPVEMADASSETRTRRTRPNLRRVHGDKRTLHWCFTMMRIGFQMRGADGVSRGGNPVGKLGGQRGVSLGGLRGLDSPGTIHRSLRGVCIPCYALLIEGVRPPHVPETGVFEASLSHAFSSIGGLPPRLGSRWSPDFGSPPMPRMRRSRVGSIRCYPRALSLTGI